MLMLAKCLIVGPTFWGAQQANGVGVFSGQRSVSNPIGASNEGKVVEGVKCIR